MQLRCRVSEDHEQGRREEDQVDTVQLALLVGREEALLEQVAEGIGARRSRVVVELREQLVAQRLTFAQRLQVTDGLLHGFAIRGREDIERREQLELGLLDLFGETAAGHDAELHRGRCKAIEEHPDVVDARIRQSGTGRAELAQPRLRNRDRLHDPTQCRVGGGPCIAIARHECQLAVVQRRKACDVRDEHRVVETTRLEGQFVDEPAEPVARDAEHVGVREEFRPGPQNGFVPVRIEFTQVAQQCVHLDLPSEVDRLRHVHEEREHECEKQGEEAEQEPAQCRPRLDRHELPGLMRFERGF